MVSCLLASVPCYSYRSDVRVLQCPCPTGAYVYVHARFFFGFGGGRCAYVHVKQCIVNCETCFVCVCAHALSRMKSSVLQRHEQQERLQALIGFNELQKAAAHPSTQYKFPGINFSGSPVVRFFGLVVLWSRSNQL